MYLNIPVFTAIRYMVYELGRPLRGFATKAEAEAFVLDDEDLRIVHIPAKFKTVEVEEAPF